MRAVLLCACATACFAPARAFAQEDDGVEGETWGDEGEDPKPDAAAAQESAHPDAAAAAAAKDAAAVSLPADAGTGGKRDAGERAQPSLRPPQNQNNAAQPAASSAGSSTARARDLPTEAELKERIEARARYLRSGDQEKAEAELGLLIEARQALGARNIVLESASLMHEANAAKSRGQLERAINLAETAAKISPDLTAAHWLRAHLYFDQSWTQIDRVARALADLVEAKLSRFRNTVALLSNLSAGIAVALLATILLFTAIQLLKYVRYPAHDFVRLLPRWFSGGEGVMVLLIAIGSPLVAGLGLPATIVLALATICAYQTTRERVVSIFSMIMLAAVPGIIYLVAPLITFHGSIADAMETAMSEAFPGDAETKLTEFTHTAGKTDVEGALILAHLYRQRGDLASAEGEYRRALSYQPGNLVARNNLGTLQYLLGREEAALATFQTASQGADRPEPLLNLASILLDRSLFDEATNAIERARKLDPALTMRYTRFDSSVSTADKLLNADIGQGPLWSRLFDVDDERREQVTLELWRTFGGVMPPLAMPILVLLAGGLGLLLARRGDALNLSTGCPKCGVPALRNAPATYCDQCQSIFLKTIAVEPILRIAKEEDVRSFSRRRRWIERGLSLVAGAGHIFSGRPIAGALLFFLLALAIAAIRFADGFIVHPWSVGLDASSATFQMGAAAVMALVLLIVSVRSAFR